MKKCLGTVGLGMMLGARVVSAQFANSVVFYQAGTGTPDGFNNPANALGEPARFTNDPRFQALIDPFNSAYFGAELVSVGAGGSLTLQMSGPIRNDVNHPYGLDFIIYGNAGFVYSDFEAGKTDGSLYGAQDLGATTVSVSADGQQFYRLDTSLAPTVDRYFPTDGAGQFGLPVDPILQPTDFNGLTLPEIRALYAGSAGGAGYDLTWARTDLGNPIFLGEINFIRIEVPLGKVEIDGIAAVPEPSTWALLGGGAAAVMLRKRRL